MKLREPMPELTGSTLWINGEVTKDQLVGEKPSLLHFWSVSCHLCKAYMSNINNLRDQYKGKLNVVAVHMPRSEDDLDEGLIKLTAEKEGITQPIFVDGEHKLSDTMDNRCVPAYYVFDKDGVLRHFQVGSGGIKMLERRVIRLINEAENVE